jgi:hypothetical protein
MTLRIAMMLAAIQLFSMLHPFLAFAGAGGDDDQGGVIAVPEPTALAILATGLGGLLFARRLHRRRGRP